MEMEPDIFGYRHPPIEHKSYFAVFPDPALAQRIERAARELGRIYNVRRVTPAGRLHVSLNGLQRGPELAPEQLEDALQIGEAIRRPAFDLVFDRIQTWGGGGRRVRPAMSHTVLCCSNPPRDAAALYDDLRRQMQHFGMKLGPRSFSPHITLWYAPARLATRNLPRPIRLRVDRLCLVHTSTDVSGPDYLASWPLKF